MAANQLLAYVGGQWINRSNGIFSSSTGTAAVSLHNTGSGPVLDLLGATSGILSLLVPATLASYQLVLPAAQGPVNGCLVNDGLGNLTWTQQAQGGQGSIQLAGPAGQLTSDPTFQWSGSALSLGSLNIGVVSSVPILDNQPSVPVFSLSATTYRNLMLDYSMSRGPDTEIGTLWITNNGTVASFSQMSTGTSLLGVSFAVSYVAGNIVLAYTSTATGNSGTLKYTPRSWI